MLDSASTTCTALLWVCHAVHQERRTGLAEFLMDVEVFLCMKTVSEDKASHLLFFKYTVNLSSNIINRQNFYSQILNKENQWDNSTNYLNLGTAQLTLHY